MCDLVQITVTLIHPDEGEEQEAKVAGIRNVLHVRGVGPGVSADDIEVDGWQEGEKIKVGHGNDCLLLWIVRDGGLVDGVVLTAGNARKLAGIIQRQAADAK